MPQLNPAPWLSILVFSWLVLLVIIPPKVMAHTFSKEPVSTSSEELKKDSWTWPWH
uniref:ATP synthase complex subunit 8 n=1 Tax=Rudarius ercodes TaxID=392931 RepID=B7ZHW9_RUDER|nr:ATPase subunit 8 [Rudarius ercodes]